MFVPSWSIHFMRFPWQCNPCTHHSVIMIYLLLEDALRFMEALWCRSEEQPHEHRASTVDLMNIRAGSDLRHSLFLPSPWIDEEPKAGLATSHIGRYWKSKDWISHPRDLDFQDKQGIIYVLKSDPSWEKSAKWFRQQDKVNVLLVTAAVTQIWQITR